MELVEDGEDRWRIPRSGGMLVDGLVFASKKLIVKAQEDRALDQVANVAHLPGIVGASMAMPDIHWGYGFPIGGVAATDVEAGGVVSPGGQYETLLSDIAAQFRALINSETGEPAVEDVYFPAKQFRGPRATELPDVAIVWNSRNPIDAVASDAIGTIAGRQESERSGNHRPAIRSAPDSRGLVTFKIECWSMILSCIN